MPRDILSPFLTHGLRAAVVMLSLAGTGTALAQKPEVPHQLPPIASIPLRSDSFDVRAFDPLGMPAATTPAVAAASPEGDKAEPAAGLQTHQEARLAALPGAQGAAVGLQGPGRPMFSDGWRRDGFGSLR